MNETTARLLRRQEVRMIVESWFVEHQELVDSERLVGWDALDDLIDTITEYGL